MKILKTPSMPPLLTRKLNLRRVKIKIICDLNSNPEMNMASFNSFRHPNRCRVEGFSHHDILSILYQKKFSSIKCIIYHNAR